jgi:hypothetical protein
MRDAGQPAERDLSHCASTVAYAAGVFGASQQSLHFLTQFGIAMPDFIKQGGTILRRTIGRAMKEFLDLRPAFRSHQ